MRAIPPIWLARPSRFSGLGPRAAQIGLALLAVLLLASLLALRAPGQPAVDRDTAGAVQDVTDIDLYQSIVAGVRSGGNYYAVTAQALRAGDYPLKPFVTFRLPTLALFEAWIPPWGTALMLYLLDAVVILAWFVRLRRAFARPPPLAVAMVMLAGGMAVFVQAELAAFHEIWAGLLIALSLALRRDDRWIEAAAFGLMAMLVRETAALYVAVMAGMALLEGRRREAAGWALTIAVLALVVALHAHAVAQVVRADDARSPGWAAMLGFGYFVQTMAVSTALRLAPAWIAALLAGFALFGWTAWRDALALRVAGTLAVYAVLLSLFGRADTFYWGLMVTPVFLVGLTFAPDGVRDLIAAARAKRRFTVTRGVR